MSNYYNTGRSSKSRWWIPANEEQRKLFEKAKEDVMCYLTINKEGVKAKTAYSKMAVDMETTGIPFQRMGFTDFGSFLFHLDDILTVRQDSYSMDCYLFLRQTGAEDELAHLQDLVNRTPSSKSYKGFKATYKNTSWAPIEKLLNINYDLRINPNPAPSSYPKRARGGGGFRVRNNLPKPRSMSSLCNKEVRPGLIRAVEAALANDDDDSDEYGMEAFDWSCDDIEMNSGSNRYCPAGAEDDEDEWEGEDFGFTSSTTASTTNKVTTTASSLPANNINNSINDKENAQKDFSKFETSLPKTENTKLTKNIIPREKPFITTAKAEELVTPVKSKKIYKTLKKMQMSLTMKSFEAELLGADEFGYFYVKPMDSTLEKCFNDFCQQIQIFYENENNQNGFLMSPNEMDEGNFIIFHRQGHGFMRGRIDQVFQDMNFCYVFAVDFCDYYTVYFNDIYHIASHFTERCSRVVQVILRKTENYMLLNDTGKTFSTICTLAFENLTQEDIEVTNISSAHPLFRAPIVDISNKNQNILPTFVDSGLVTFESAPSSLTPKQYEVLQTLERKSHVVPVPSLQQLVKQLL